MWSIVKDASLQTNSRFILIKQCHQHSIHKYFLQVWSFSVKAFSIYICPPVSIPLVSMSTIPLLSFEYLPPRAPPSCTLSPQWSFFAIIISYGLKGRVLSSTNITCLYCLISPFFHNVSTFKSWLMSCFRLYTFYPNVLHPVVYR
jgi:hypothetical protein